MTDTETPIEVTRDACLVWLQNNCGAGLPYGEATGLKDALHGTAYVLRQIESSPRYEVNIGQCVSATTSLRWLLEYVARNELTTEAQSAEIARLKAENERLREKKRYIYVLSMCVLYRLSLKKWYEYITLSLKNWQDIGEYGEALGEAHNVTDWEADDFRRAKAALAGESA